MDAVLELRNVCKRFGPHAAVQAVSFRVEPGSLFALLGPSGCGKTTTLRLIAGLEVPDAGEILLRGRRIEHLRPYERPVSTVFQNYALFPHLTARGNVEFGLRRQRLAPEELRRRTEEALHIVQLTGKEHRYPHELSGGERQRVALARSLALRPEVLLLDEPLSALDPNLRRQVRSDLRALQREVAVTFVLVTHDQEEALSMADRIALMREGRIEQTGTPRELYTRPCSRFVASFLGAVNWIDGAGVRPEATRVSRDQPGAAVRSYTGIVEGSTYLGNCTHVHARMPWGDLVTAEVAHRSDFGPGEKVHVWWHPEDEMNGFHDGS